MFCFVSSFLKLVLPFCLVLCRCIEGVVCACLQFQAFFSSETWKFSHFRNWSAVVAAVEFIYFDSFIPCLRSTGPRSYESRAFGQ